jgi:hypothetical protein
MRQMKELYSGVELHLEIEVGISVNVLDKRVGQCPEARVKFKNIDFWTEADLACYCT